MFEEIKTFLSLSLSLDQIKFKQNTSDTVSKINNGISRENGLMF